MHLVQQHSFLQTQSPTYFTPIKDEVHFCCHSQCQVNINFWFLRNKVCKIGKSFCNGTSYICFQLYKKNIDKIYGTLSIDDRRPIPLCIMELIQLLSPDKNERRNVLWHIDVNTINQLEEYQLKDGEEVFHIWVILSIVDVDNFIERSSMIVPWETHHMNEMSQNKNWDLFPQSQFVPWNNEVSLPQFCLH